MRNRRGEVIAEALVDDELHAWLSRWAWSLGSHGYAMRLTRIDGRRCPVYMHRQILGLERGDGRATDHINRDKLDNRRENLRIATQAENLQNRPSVRGSSSRYRGVSLNRQQRWCAAATINGRSHFLGSYADEDEAARVVAAFRAEHMPFSEEAAAS